MDADVAGARTSQMRLEAQRDVLRLGCVDPGGDEGG